MWFALTKDRSNNAKQKKLLFKQEFCEKTSAEIGAIFDN